MTTPRSGTEAHDDSAKMSLPDILAAKLAALQAERVRVLAELAPPPDGDLADRATNVDAHARLALIERRIAAVEAELVDSEARYGPAAPTASDATAGVALGDRLTLDFGEGPEQFYFAPVDVADEGRKVITPSSPLGRALHGAAIGSTVSYDTVHGPMSVLLVALEAA